MPAPAAASAAEALSAGASRLKALARSGVAWGLLTATGVSLWILYGLGGLDYYETPLGIRAYAPSHRWLRPSGPAGQSFGLVGTLMMLVPFAYMARKRFSGLRNVGTVKGWLEVHLFCGIVGPVLVTFHTSFKFNGIISAAYWSMVIVVLSGFAGRHLYVRIPRSLKGNELTRAELERSAVALKDEISGMGVDAPILTKIDALEAQLAPTPGRSLFDALFGELLLARRMRAFERELVEGGVPTAMSHTLVRLSVERTLVLRRAADLQRTKRLFQLWHVFHLPLVYLLLIIAAAHIGLALYMGYVPFRW